MESARSFGLWWLDFRLSRMQEVSSEAIIDNRKMTFAVLKSNKSRVAGKLRYWWCWVAAAALLLFVGAPALSFLWIIDRRLWLYPLALWGAETWLRLCGARVKVSG